MIDTQALLPRAHSAVKTTLRPEQGLCGFADLGQVPVGPVCSLCTSSRLLHLSEPPPNPSRRRDTSVLLGGAASGLQPETPVKVQRTVSPRQIPPVLLSPSLPLSRCRGGRRPDQPLQDARLQHHAARGPAQDAVRLLIHLSAAPHRLHLPQRHRAVPAPGESHPPWNLMLCPKGHPLPLLLLGSQGSLLTPGVRTLEDGPRRVYEQGRWS